MGVVGMWRYPGYNGFVSRMIEIRSLPVSESLGMFIKCRFLAVTNDLKTQKVGSRNQYIKQASPDVS